MGAILWRTKPNTKSGTEHELSIADCSPGLIIPIISGKKVVELNGATQIRLYWDHTPRAVHTVKLQPAHNSGHLEDNYAAD